MIVLKCWLFLRTLLSIWKSRGEKQIIINYFSAKIPIELAPAIKAGVICKKFFNFEQYVTGW